MWVVACDHAAIDLKDFLKAQLEGWGESVLDVSSQTRTSEDNYATIADRLCAAIKTGKAQRGLLLCGTGTGSAIRANRYPGIRAALVTDEYMAEMARAHNDANVVVFGSRVTTPHNAERMLKLFYNTAFDGGRHTPRVAAIDAPLACE